MEGKPDICKLRPIVCYNAIRFAVLREDRRKHQADYMATQITADPLKCSEFWVVITYETYEQVFCVVKEE